MPDRTSEMQLDEDQVERLGLVGVRAIVRRNLTLFLSVFVAVMLVAVLVVLFKDRLYVTGSVIVLDDRRVTIRADLRPIANLEVALSEMQTEVEIIRSRDFAEKVVKRLGLDEDPTYNPLWMRGLADAYSPVENLTETTSKLLESYVVSPYRNTLGIGIQVHDTNPSRAAQIANEIARTYIDLTLEIQQSSAHEKIDLLVDRMGELEEEISGIEAELSNLILSNQLDDKDEGTALSAELRNVLVRLRFLSESEAPQSEIEPLEQRVERVQAQLEQRSKAAQERITLEQRLEDLLARRQILFQRNRDLAVHAGLMEPLARQISVAQPPLEPALPNRNTVLAGSFASALVIAFITILLREMLNKRLFVRRSVHPALGLQGALAFPRFPRTARHSISALLALFDQRMPPDPRAEGARHVLSVLMDRLSQDGSARMLITSSSQTDQSAFVTLCLSVSAAKDGLRVLFIDLDPTDDPSVADLLPRDRSQYGLPLLLGNALLMTQETVEIAEKVKYVRPSGNDQVPVDLFDSHNMWSGTAALSDLYDQIVIHVPPITENAALGRLLSFTDNVVFITRDQSSGVEEIVRSLEKLRQLNLEPTKLVNFG
ncbi:hypothetical protein [Ruegeria sp. EL01]|jgi:uncharacterized protein involved in exopolysaccharide biosynthesis/Mrp family chromosome partitioning ATPase|uniref:hypothetical protein n=1 Tax=Ruegeria sp. EL01 TaxID=2107578 RepID=UPI000EA8327B|nr:hypothetical protein [Ruegeria sp. EL01]